MKTPLRILQLEDNTVDAELITATLTEGGIPCQSQLVDTRQAFVAALKEGRMDLILSGSNMRASDFPPGIRHQLVEDRKKSSRPEERRQPWHRRPRG